MLKTNKRRILSFAAMLIIVMSVFASFGVTASAASWQTGNFDSGYTARGYTTVRLSNTKKAGYIKVYSYDKTGRKTSGDIHITLRDNRGRWICEFDTTSGTKLKLGNDHSLYRVYVAKKQFFPKKNTLAQRTWADGKNFENDGKCQMWAINTTANCYI